MTLDSTSESCDATFDSLFGHPEPDFLTIDSLGVRRQWVAWREEARNGKPTKVPYDPATLRGAKANDRSTWGTRVEAEAAAIRLLTGGRRGGVGIQLGGIDGDGDRLIGGLDLDSSLDVLDGSLEPWAAEAIARFASYAEVSPSGRGLKIYFTYAADGAEPLRDAMRSSEGKERHRISWSRGSHHEIGLDVSNRYYAVTGKLWPGTPMELRPVAIETLLWLIRDAGPAFLGSSGPAGDTKASTKRDESGSGYGFRFLVDQALLGTGHGRALELLAADDGAAGEWAGRASARELERTWKSAKAQAESRRPIDPETAMSEDFDADPLDPVDPTTGRLNRRHALVVVRGRSLATTERTDGSIDFGTVGDLDTFYANDRVPVGENRTEPASKRWLRDVRRRTYPNGVTFAPGGAPPGTLNLWRGWAVDADASASCDLFLKHVRNVVCRGDADHYAYVIGWLAHMVQRPDEKPGVGLVLKGAKGAGKDTLADYVAQMIGRRHAPTVAESDHIVGKFNARLEAALLLHVQEGSWAGDRKAEGVLKYLVTSDFIEIERKGIDSINLPSVLRLFISANAEWVVPASADERRWAVFNVSDARRGDDAYFTALRAEMNGEGPAALLHYLREYDLSGFNVRKAPDTEGLRDQKLASLRNINRWWYDELSRGELSSGFDDDGIWSNEAVTIERETLRSRYAAWMKGQKFEAEVSDEARFGRQMREMLPEIGDKHPRVSGSRIRQYVLPALRDCRAAFDQWLGSAVAWEME